MAIALRSGNLESTCAEVKYGGPRRAHAATGKNKSLCSPLALLIIVQFLSGIITTIYSWRQQGGSFDARSFTPVDGHPDSELPEEILRLFRLCTRQKYKPGALAYVNIHLFSVCSHRPTSTFSALKYLAFYVIDIFAFLIIVVSVGREIPTRSLRITPLWDVILRDATLYFMFMAFIQSLTLLFLFTTSVGGVCVQR